MNLEDTFRPQSGERGIATRCLLCGARYCSKRLPCVISLNTSALYRVKAEAW